jgi:hypothetical protein
MTQRLRNPSPCQVHCQAASKLSSTIGQQERDGRGLEVGMERKTNNNKTSCIVWKGKIKKNQQNWVGMHFLEWLHFPVEFREFCWFSFLFRVLSFSCSCSLPTSTSPSIHHPPRSLLLGVCQLEPWRLRAWCLCLAQPTARLHWNGRGWSSAMAVQLRVTCPTR